MNLTPTQKADELIEKYENTTIHLPYIDLDNDQAIGEGCMTYLSAARCAIIAVDDKLIDLQSLSKPEYTAFDVYEPRLYNFNSEYPDRMTGYDMIAFYEEVKQILTDRL